MQRFTSTYEETVVNSDGEVLRTRSVRQGYRAPGDYGDRYVKFYPDSWVKLGNLKTINFMVLMGLLRFGSFAEDRSPQTVRILAPEKKELAEQLGIAVRYIDQCLSNLVKTGIFRRMDRGVYQVNPHYIGIGQEASVRSLRKLYDGLD